MADDHSADKASGLMLNPEHTWSVWSSDSSYDSPLCVRFNHRANEKDTHTHTHTHCENIPAGNLPAVNHRATGWLQTHCINQKSLPRPSAPPKSQGSDGPHTGFRSVFDINTLTLPNASVAARSCCARTTEEPRRRRGQPGLQTQGWSFDMTAERVAAPARSNVIKYDIIDIITAYVAWQQLVCPEAHGLSAVGAAVLVLKKQKIILDWTY